MLFERFRDLVRDRAFVAGSITSLVILSLIFGLAFGISSDNKKQKRMVPILAPPLPPARPPPPTALESCYHNASAGNLAGTLLISVHGADKVRLTR